MSSSVYEVFAFAMRYWFMGIIIIMLAAIIIVSVREYRQRRYVMGEIGSFIGCIEIIRAPKALKGKRIGIAKENYIGRSKNCDIMINDPSIKKRHAYIYCIDKGRGVKIILNPLDKMKINGRIATREHEIYPGDILSIGDIDVKLYLKKEIVNGN